MRPDHPGVIVVVAHSLSCLARRVRQLDEEIRDLDRRLAAAVRAGAPRLLELRGIGVDGAATLLVVVGDNPHWLPSEASFAALCGVSPVEASSGKTHRHRSTAAGIARPTLLCSVRC